MVDSTISLPMLTVNDRAKTRTRAKMVSNAKGQEMGVGGWGSKD